MMYIRNPDLDVSGLKRPGKRRRCDKGDYVNPNAHFPTFTGLSAF